MMKPDCYVIWMIPKHTTEVLDIEFESFEFPWTWQNFRDCLCQRNCIGMVAEHGDRVGGFMVYELHENRIRVLNFAVAPDLRRQGIGTAMVEKLIGKLSSQRRSRITLEVRESNLLAQLFFRSQGFRAVAVLRGFYSDTDEDAYVFQRRYKATAESETKVRATVPR